MGTNKKLQTKKMEKIVEQVKKYFEEATQEELDKTFEELKHWNEIGPTVDEYLENLKKYKVYPNETDNNNEKQTSENEDTVS